MSYIQNVLGDAPQTQQAEASQVPNSGGGYAFTLAPLKRLERFLVLGSDSPTYYASAQKLTRENALCVIESWKSEPALTAGLIVDISTLGRAPKNDPAVFALALGLASDNRAAREMAKHAVNLVCRTGTHLFQLVDAVDKLRGWGRGLRGTIAQWYADKTADDAAYQVVKYQSRDGWSHRDVLRLVHPKAPSPRHAALYRWIVGASPAERTVARQSKCTNKLGAVYQVTVTAKGYPEVGKENIPRLVVGYERAKRAKSVEEVVALVDEYGLTHEMIPGDWKSNNEVWAKLAEKMPLHALVRNLGNLTARGILAPFSNATVRACNLLTNVDALKKSRMHPLALLMAQRQYAKGQGDKGKLTWSPLPIVIEALEKAFYASFATVEPTGKRILIALDVSASMGWTGDPTPRELGACLAMVTMRTEQNWHVVGFSAGLSRLGITPSMSLKDVCNYTSRLPQSSTDCALPMLWAHRSKTPVDAFVVITDNETNGGSIHPHGALQKYRAEVNPQAKLAVIAMTPTNFTIAQPDDAGMMDFCGFDSSGPQVLADFIRS